MSEYLKICRCGKPLKYIKPYSGGGLDEYQCEDEHVALLPVEVKNG